MIRRNAHPASREAADAPDPQTGRARFSIFPSASE
jgi:hypothetical protein